MRQKTTTCQYTELNTRTTPLNGGKNSRQKHNDKVTNHMMCIHHTTCQYVHPITCLSALRGGKISPDYSTYVTCIQILALLCDCLKDKTFLILPVKSIEQNRRDRYNDTEQQVKKKTTNICS